MRAIKPNATRMQAAVAFVAANPGSTTQAVVRALLTPAAENSDEWSVREARSYKRAAAVVERVIKDRHVRQDAALRLHPWDERRRAYAEALERAANLAPDEARRRSTRALACAAWREAGDENRARLLERNDKSAS